MEWSGVEWSGVEWRSSLGRVFCDETKMDAGVGG